MLWGTLSNEMLQRKSYHKEKTAQCFLMCVWHCLTLGWRKFTPKPSFSKVHKSHLLAPLLVWLPVQSQPGLRQAWFQIVSGTRQGCTLSRVLFISTLRPLITIKNNDAIKIIQIRDNQFQLPLLADGITGPALSSALLKDSSLSIIPLSPIRPLNYTGN